MSREQLTIVVPLAELDAQDFLSTVEYMVEQVERSGAMDVDWGTVVIQRAAAAQAALQGWTGPAFQLTVQVDR